jgi:CheY-like chemotaxis protein
MIDARPTFLLVDHNKDSRFLLVKCLYRKFPDAVILEAADGEGAIALAAREDLAAIVTHRTAEYFGTELVKKFREVNATVPIVMVSGIERTGPALAAGADRFMLYDEWLRIGTIVKDLLADQPRAKVVHVKVAGAATEGEK